MKMRIDSYVKQTSFFYILWNKILIFMFQGLLFQGINLNLVNLKQTHLKFKFIVNVSYDIFIFEEAKALYGN